MMFCNVCNKDVRGIRDAEGILSCNSCGKVLLFDNFSTEVTFFKNASGQSQMAGRFVKSIHSENLSRDRLYSKAYDDLTDMKNRLEMGENMDMVNQAMKYYRIAVDRNFNKGRERQHVLATCLYIACRENNKPYFLMDFSNYLKVNIYVLGAVFLKLCHLLHLSEHPIVQKLLDPSIFIHRYTAGLLGAKNKEVASVALVIISDMNRNWMQTGRRPSGVWGMALYIAANFCGLSCTKLDVMKQVHVCEATLLKRLVEFENTSSGSLTIEELMAKAEEEKEMLSAQAIRSKLSSSKDLLCQHRGTNRPAYKLGICVECYGFFHGYDGGADPPAFQRAEIQRKLNSSNVNETDGSGLCEEGLDNEDVDRDGKVKRKESVPVEAACEADGTGACNDVNEDASDNFSDIDDDEVDGYLHNEEETRLKTIIWEEVNKEYLEEQAAKEAAAAAAKEASEANFENCSEDVQRARKLNEDAIASVAKAKKERQQKRAQEERDLPPAKSPAEAAYRMLKKKKLSSKINYEMLQKLFAEPGDELKEQENYYNKDLPADVNQDGDHNNTSENMNQNNDMEVEENEEGEEEDNNEGAYDGNLFDMEEEDGDLDDFDEF